MAKVIGTVGKAWGVGVAGRKLKAPEIAMPDQEAIERDAKKRLARRARRAGRPSTILDEETLG
jgi:hypothetical protein